jgi:DNA mismatch repair protein MutS
MLHVADLHIESEIAPLFDHTCNEHAAAALRHLLTELPVNATEVSYRQQVIKGFMANSRVLEHFSYSRIDMGEVHTFLTQVLHQAKNRGEGESYTLQLRFGLMLSPAEKQRLSARVNQFIGMFYRLQTHYFQPLQKAHFPPEFRQLAERLVDFMQFLELEKYEAPAREGRLKAAQLVSIMSTLETAARTNRLSSFWQDLFLFEAYLSAAKAIVARGFVFPEFVAQGISLEQFYHPLLKSPVKNDLQTESNVILLTGPNMAGKSTVLKAISLCIYLAHAGFAVPAAACRIPFFRYLSVAINASDDILSGYSHFLNEVKTLKQTVLQAQEGQNCFAVFDELFKGTNMEDAVSITQTTIAGLTKWPGSCFFISTHLHQLKDAVAQLRHKIDCYHVACTIEEGRPVFTYQLQKGWSDLKIGRLLFDSEGLGELLA